MLVVVIRFLETMAFPNNAYLFPAFDIKSNDLSINAPVRNLNYCCAPVGETVTVFSAPIPEIAKTLKKPAIMITTARWRAAISYCGQRAPSLANRSIPDTNKAFAPVYFPLKRGLCDDAVLEVRVDAGRQTPSLGRVYLGEEREIHRAFAWRRFAVVEFPLFATGTAALMTLLCVAALPLYRRLRFAILLALLMGVYTLRNTYYVGPIGAMSPIFADLLFALSTYALLGMSVVFINEWTEKRSLIRAIFAPLLGVSIFMILLFSAIGALDLGRLAIKVVYAIGAVCLIHIVLQVWRSYMKEPTAPVLQGMLFMAPIWAGVIDLVSSTFPGFGPTLFGASGLTIPYTPMMPVPIGIAVLTFVGQESRDIQHRLTQTNLYLSSELQKREEEVSQAYAAREEQEKMATVLRERQRIMEDVHDGFGGRLLALLLQAEKNTLKPKDLSDGLRDSLQDLRLIIDSLDTADGDIGLALGALRGRIEPQVRAGGLKLEWKMDVPADLDTDLTPRRILSVYRIIQEAVTNAVRHSGGTNVSVSIFASQDQNLEIIVKDNGTGIPERKKGQPPSGRGLRNIESRVNGLQGDVDFRSSAGGLSVVVSVPTRYDSPVID